MADENAMPPAPARASGRPGWTRFLPRLLECRPLEVTTKDNRRAQLISTACPLPPPPAGGNIPGR